MGILFVLIGISSALVGIIVALYTIAAMLGKINETLERTRNITECES